jgi:glycosyltransferase involved in cell wall biosynthesis
VTTVVRHVLPGYGYFPDDATDAPMSGITYVAYQLARAAARSGDRASLLTYSNGGDRMAFTIDGVDVRRVRPRRALAFRRRDFSYTGPLAMLGWSERVDIAHVHTNPYNFRAIRSARRVVHYHTRDFKPLPAYRRALARADALIFCSAALQRQFAAVLGDVLVPQYVVYNGTYPERFRNREEDGARFRARFGIGADEVVVLFAGSIYPEKGLHVLVDAVARARARVERRLRLVVVGSSTIWHTVGQAVAMSDYERGVRAVADPSLVTFAGALPQGEMPAAYAAADFTACPSVWQEPFPVVNVEVMAAGKPIVASRVGGIPELVDDGVTGLLVEPERPAELAEAIVALANDPARRRAFGAAGRRRAERLSWGAISDQVREIYAAIGVPGAA